MPATQRLAYFISAHGYGHAARAAAIMAALRQLEPALHFEIFSQIPPVFFEESLGDGFTYHRLLTDIGVAQKNSLTEDLPETVRRLDQFIPFDPAQIQRLARRLTNLACRSILCDIAPLGIAVARAAGLPAMLVENFTWDWIYEGYLSRQAGLRPHIEYLRGVYEAADFRLQTEPVCHYQPAAGVIPSLISRQFRTPVRETRQTLELPEQAPAVLITVGGIRGKFEFLEQLKHRPDIYFVIPGASERLLFEDNLRLLPHHSGLFHPDLVQAMDAVIGKIGYSTLAEVYYAGLPFGYVARRNWPESRALVEYVEAHLNGLAIAEDQFQAATWLPLLPELLALPRLTRHHPNGADQAARFILEKL
jgi:hypothetical protein